MEFIYDAIIFVGLVWLWWTQICEAVKTDNAIEDIKKQLEKNTSNIKQFATDLELCQKTIENTKEFAGKQASEATKLMEILKSDCQKEFDKIEKGFDAVANSVDHFEKFMATTRLGITAFTDLLKKMMEIRKAEESKRKRTPKRK